MKAVIFDMDDTLITTEKCNIRYWCEAGVSFGFDVVPENIIYTRSLDERLVRKYLAGRFGDPFDFDSVCTKRRS